MGLLRHHIVWLRYYGVREEPEGGCGPISPAHDGFLGGWVHGGQGVFEWVVILLVDILIEGADAD